MLTAALCVGNQVKMPGIQYSWSFIWVIILCLGAVGVGGYAVYKYRIRVCFLSPKIPHTCTYVKCSSRYKSWRKTLVLLFCSLYPFDLWGDPKNLYLRRDTWTQRSGQSWHSTCHWITKEKFPIMSPAVISETEKGRDSYDKTALEKGRHSTAVSNQELPPGTSNWFYCHDSCYSVISNSFHVSSSASFSLV